MARRVAGILFVLLSILSVGCDHATKYAASEMLQNGPPVDVVSGVVDLEYTQNHDISFNLIDRVGLPVADARLVLIAFGSLLIAGMLVAWWRRRRDPSRLLHAGFALLVAGAIGNVADRMLRGYVVDFIHVRYWPVFNVADVAVVLGMIALAFVGQSRAASKDARV
ncbi:MAG TPA: signal peptidase II [Polyangiaceae bacterium]